MGTIERIWVKRARRGPMDPQGRATLRAGVGIVGNANQGGERQVVILNAERWKRVQEEAGADLDPVIRRGNVLVSGLLIEGSEGRILRLGSCRIRIRGETHPCHRMDEAHPGLCALLTPDWGGGAHGEVVEGGEIVVGDSASIENDVS